MTGTADARVPATDLIDAYIAHAKLALPDPGRLGRFRMAIDAANGATTPVAPRLFRELEFDVEVLGAAPDGRNINLQCGSTHPEHLSSVVRERRCQMGVAFDGDGDRAIFVDASGRVVDGDAVLCGPAPKSIGLRETPCRDRQSNIGLEMALHKAASTSGARSATSMMEE